MCGPNVLLQTTGNEEAAAAVLAAVGALHVVVADYMADCKTYEKKIRRSDNNEQQKFLKSLFFCTKVGRQNQ